MTDTCKPKVLLADDHRIVAEGITQLLQPYYDVLPPVSNGESLIKAALTSDPDIIVSDIAMPGINGIDAFRRVRMVKLHIPFIVLTMHAEPAVVENALKCDVQGYVLKESAGEELLRAMSEVLRGGVYICSALLPNVMKKSQIPVMTVRQQSVLTYLANGLRSREIAEKLNLSIRTVEAYRQSLIQLFEVRNSIELVRKAEQMGMMIH